MNNASSHSADLKQLDRLCDEFESAWRRGQRPHAERFLERLPPAQRPRLLRELLALELEYRTADDGPADLAEYEARFSQWPQVVRDVFRFEAGSTARGRSAEGTRSFDSGNDEPQARLDAGRLPHVPGYEVLAILGRGAMGVVYQARHLRLGRIVALKMLMAGGHADRQHLDRFRAEAEAIAALQHPNIVQVFEIGEHEGLPYFALEHVSGGTLRERIGGVPQSPREAARLTTRLAAAVQAAHDQGVIHRDIKPSNVLLTTDGAPKLTDFGLARRLESDSEHTRTGDVVGTPSYMAPEQAGGRIRDVGPRSDVYALGAVLYEQLTGRPPFRGETGWDTVAQVLSQDPLSPRRLQPKVPRDLETICLKCLARAPRDRYATAVELAHDLDRWLEGRPIIARPLGWAGRSAKFVRRKPAIAALIAVVLISATTALAGLALHNRRLSSALDDVSTQRDRAVKAEGEASQNLARAETTHEKARAAVNDCFALVTENELFQGLGMEPARRLLLEAAAGYFAELATLRATTPAERFELAETLYKLGVIRHEIGDQQQALAALDRSRQTLQQLAAEGIDASLVLAQALQKQATIEQELGTPSDEVLKRFEAAESAANQRLAAQPADEEAPYVRAIIRFNRGKVHEDRELHESAMAEYAAAMTDLKRLETTDPRIVKYRVGIAMADVAQGRVYRRLGNAAAARESYEAAQERLAALLEKLPQAPHLQFHQALALIELAKLDTDHAAALGRYQAALRYLNGLHLASPAVHEYKLAAAACLTHVGDEYAQINQAAEALEHYDQAEQLYEELRDDNPDNVELAIEHARTLQESALLLSRIGQSPQAEDKYERALALREQLVLEQPQRPELRQDLSRNLNNLAVLHLERGDAVQAKVLLAKALSERLALTEQFPKVPEYRRDVAGACMNLDQAYRALGEHDLAAATLDQAIALLRDLHRDFPENGDYLRLLAGGLANAGGLRFYDLDEAAAAKTLLLDARPIMEQLEQRLPDDREAQGVLIVFWFTLGQIQLQGREAAAALECFDHALGPARAVLAKNPRDADAQNSLAMTLQNRALALGSQRQMNEAFAAWSASLAAHEQAARLNPAAPKYAADLDAALAAFVEQAREAKRFEDALSACQRRAALRREEPGSLLEIAVALALCGQAAEEAALADPARAEFDARLQAEAMATLRQAVAAGLADAEQLRTHPAFAALRRTVEFQQLLEQAAANR